MLICYACLIKFKCIITMTIYNIMNHLKINLNGEVCFYTFLFKNINPPKNSMFFIII